MYHFQPIKVAECPTEEGPKMFFLHDWDQIYTSTFYFWYFEGHGHKVLYDVGFDLEDGLWIMPTLVQHEDWRPANRLQALGIDPEEIDTIVLSHAHFDHLSCQIDCFPNATFYLRTREMQYALCPTHSFFTFAYDLEVCRRLAFEYADRLRLVENYAEILPEFWVVPTGGHTPGHQSLIVRTSHGRTGFTGDLCFMYRNFREDIPVGLFWNIEECYLSMERMRSCTDLLLPGHDPLLEQQYPLPAGV